MISLGRLKIISNWKMKIKKYKDTDIIKIIKELLYKITESLRNIYIKIKRSKLQLAEWLIKSTTE